MVGHKAAMRRAAAILLIVLAVLAPTRAPAVEAPFDAGLMRLAEVLGSLHFLRNLCGEKGTVWRDQMQNILDSENPDPARRAQFIAGFNRGYRSFEGTYTSCTASAIKAIERYVREGERLSREIATSFGN